MWMVRIVFAAVDVTVVVDPKIWMTVLYPRRNHDDDHRCHHYHRWRPWSRLGPNGDVSTWVCVLVEGGGDWSRKKKKKKLTIESSFVFDDRNRSRSPPSLVDPYIVWSMEYVRYRFGWWYGLYLHHYNESGGKDRDGILPSRLWYRKVDPIEWSTSEMIPIVGRSESEEVNVMMMMRKTDSDHHYK